MIADYRHPLPSCSIVIMFGLGPMTVNKPLRRRPRRRGDARARTHIRIHNEYRRY